MSEEFKREIRYDVVKLKTGKNVNCVVVEEDWPEYEIVWRMIQDRMEGRPNELSAMKQHAEAAEARIKASQEQEPFMWITQSGLRVPDKNVQREIAIANGWISCYVAPVIPPDVAELQRDLRIAKAHEAAEADANKTLAIQISELQRENAELTRKLAEESNLKNLYRGELEQTADQMDELTKLLAEAKSKAVPDELHNVLITVFRALEFTEDYNDGNAPGHAHDTPGVWDDDNGDLSGTECAWCKLWNTAKKMLAAAPQPGGSNE